MTAPYIAARRSRTLRRATNIAAWLVVGAAVAIAAMVAMTEALEAAAVLMLEEVGR